MAMGAPDVLEIVAGVECEVLSDEKLEDSSLGIGARLSQTAANV
jgi:hypothetical protein